MKMTGLLALLALLTFSACGCYTSALLRDKADLEMRRLARTDVEAKAIIETLTVKPPEVLCDSDGVPLPPQKPELIDPQSLSPEELDELVRLVCNAALRIEHNTARLKAWAKATVIYYGAVKPRDRIELDSEEEHTRNAQLLAESSERAYNLKWWRALVSVYEDAKDMLSRISTTRFWIKWGGIAGAVVFAYFGFKQWRGKRRELAAEREAIEALNRIKAKDKDLVVEAVDGLAHLKCGFERERLRAPSGGDA